MAQLAHIQCTGHVQIWRSWWGLIIGLVEGTIETGNPSYLLMVKNKVSCRLFPWNQSIWVNDNISLTWIVRPFGDDFPKINHDSSEGGQWGRDNLPRSIDLTFQARNHGVLPICWWKIVNRAGKEPLKRRLEGVKHLVAQSQEIVCVHHICIIVYYIDITYTYIYIYIPYRSKLLSKKVIGLGDHYQRQLVPKTIMGNSLEIWWF